MHISFVKYEGATAAQCAEVDDWVLTNVPHHFIANGELRVKGLKYMVCGSQNPSAPSMNKIKNQQELLLEKLSTTFPFAPAQHWQLWSS